MTFFPDMKTIVTMGGLQITWYAVIILSAAFVSYFLSVRQFKKMGYKEAVFENFFLYMMPIAILGARCWYVLFQWEYYIHDPIRIFYIWEGGLAIHGGIIAATIFGYFYFKKKAMNGLRIADVIFPNLLIAQAIGRWGNFMNQEAYGGIVSENFYQGWPSFIKDQMWINGEYRQPTFLYEAVGNIIGFCLITFIFKKYGRKKRGDLAFAYLAWYGVVRLFVEGLRTDSLMLGDLRIAQIISILSIFIGVSGILGLWDCLFHKNWLFKKQKPVVLFDLDGTLLDTEKLIFASFEHVFKIYKPEYTLSEAELKSFLGPTLEQTFSKYFKEDQLEEVIRVYRAFNKEHHDAYVTVMDGAHKTLAYLSEHGYDIGVVSNKQAETVQHGLVFCGLHSFVKVVVDSTMVKQPKPDPEGILKACEMLYRSHDDMIYVGDSVTDIQATKRVAGFSIAVLFDPTREEELRKAKPMRCIYHLEEIIELVKEDLEWSDNTI